MKKIYDKVSKQWIPIGDAEYAEYHKMTNTYRRKEQRRGNCNCPRSKWWICDSECSMCAFYRGNDSLDNPVGEDEMSLLEALPSDLPLTENTVEHKELLVALYDELSKLSPEDYKLCKFLANYSKTDAAKKMGISRDALRWRWKKVQEHLAKKLQKFL